MNINNLSISIKLAIAFILTTSITLIIGIYSIVKLQESTDVTHNLFYHSYTVGHAVKDIHLDILDINILVQKAILNNKNINEIKSKIALIEVNIDENFKLIFKHSLGSQKNIDAAYKRYLKSKVFRSTIFNTLSTQGDIKAKELINKEWSENIDPLNKSIHFLIDYHDNKATESYNMSRKIEDKSFQHLSTLIIISLVFSSIISLVTIQGILSPIRKLINITNQIISGKLTLTQDKLSSLSNRKDEIGTLFNSFYEVMSYLLLPYTDAAKANRSLADRTDEIRRLLDSFDKYVLASKTDLKGRITYMSTALEHITGYSASSLIGKSHNFMRHSDMSSAVFKELWETILSGQTWIGEIKNKKKDGSSFWIRTIITQDVNTNGETVGFNAISEDITSKKAYEELSLALENRVTQEVEKNDEKTAHMIQQSRLAQMGEMISMIAHQWRQPLSAISSISSTLTIDIMLGNYKEDFFKERLESIDELSQHLSTTIDDFRNFFKNNKAKEDSNLNDIINSCLNVISPSLTNKNIDIHLHTNEDIKINTYTNELKQVILNIVKNAEDALLETSTTDPEISITTQVKDSFVFIYIEDNAGGVPENIINKIFDPYFSTKKKKDGTGLGLYMSKTIIEEHCDGKITLENGKKGAVFTIALPYTQEGDTNE